MIARLILLIAVIVGVLWFLRWFARTPAPQVASAMRRGLLWGGIGILVIAALTGRLNPIFALLAAAVPMVLRIVNLLQLLPLAQRLLRGLGLAGGPGSAGGAEGRTSSIRTDYLEMALDHASGHLHGLVRKGRFQGRRLAELDLDELLDLLGECRTADPQSAAVLESYLDREHGADWAERAGGRSAGAGLQGSGPLSKEEAREILGLAPNAGADEIRAAHRRLIQKYHPDRGGSDYLAAKINEAKRLLLGD